MIQLSAEETLVLLGSRPELTPADSKRMAALIKGAVDWAYVLWRCETCQTLPLLRAHIAGLGLEARIPAHAALYMANWSALSAARSLEQFRALGEILRLLEEGGIDYHLMKGAAIAGLLYDDPLTRPMQDLDIMIRPADAWRVQRLMYANGYAHGVFVPETGRFHAMFRKITPASLQKGHALYSMTRVVHVAPPVPEAAVLPEWRRRQLKSAFTFDGSYAIPIFVDFHVTLSEGIEEADVWAGVSPRVILGQRVNVQALTTMLWFSAARVYHEAFSYSTIKLQMLGDIDALLRRYGDEIDWALLLAQADKYGFAPPLFYVLSQARAVFGVKVPEAVLALLMPDAKAAPSRADLGDIMPKLLSRPVVNRFAMA